MEQDHGDPGCNVRYRLDFDNVVYCPPGTPSAIAGGLAPTSADRVDTHVPGCLLFKVWWPGLHTLKKVNIDYNEDNNSNYNNDDDDDDNNNINDSSSSNSSDDDDDNDDDDDDDGDYDDDDNNNHSRSNSNNSNSSSSNNNNNDDDDDDDTKKEEKKEEEEEKKNKKKKKSEYPENTPDDVPKTLLCRDKADLCDTSAKANISQNPRHATI